MSDINPASPDYEKQLAEKMLKVQPPKLSDSLQNS
jgi:hypothetical protein